MMKLDWVDNKRYLIGGAIVLVILVLGVIFGGSSDPALSPASLGFWSGSLGTAGALDNYDTCEALTIAVIKGENVKRACEIFSERGCYWAEKGLAGLCGEEGVVFEE